MLATQIPTSSGTTYDHGDEVERADIYQAHSDSLNFGGDGRDEVLGCAVHEKIDTSSPYVALGDVSPLPPLPTL